MSDTATSPLTAPGIGAARISGTAPVGAQVYRLLRDQIIGMQLLPGERLSEAEIARLLQVSRQPVREAFIKLSEDDLVEVRPQRGTFVRRISQRAVKEARSVREAIEADIVRHVATSHNKTFAAELRIQLAEQRAVAEEDAVGFVRLDERFHQSLAEAADNPFAWSVIRGIKSQMDRVRYLSMARFPMRKLIAQHAAIVDAIEAADGTRAEAAMRVHLREILADLPVIHGEHPEYFEPAS